MTGTLLRSSLYETAGGDAAFLALAQAHHARCLADSELNHPFSHRGHPQHVERLAAYWGEVLGGPPRYSEAHGGSQSHVLRLHAGNGDMTDLGRRFVACFVQAMEDAGLPADSEFRAAMRAYMEAAVAEVLRYGSPDETVPRGRPMPRWGWDGWA